MLTEELERANDALINTAKTTIMEKEKITTLTRTLADFIKWFRIIEAKLDKLLEGKVGAGVSIGNLKTEKDVMVPAYWKTDGKHIWDQVKYFWFPWYCAKPDSMINSRGTSRLSHARTAWGALREEIEKSDENGGYLQNI